ncbi:unnamed protein product [Porites evermanni]|uniref:Uncharacterized protein n=1 Tax=Porites evermanni TaxID=104178 RepID=A0ABN8T1W5_9CNID|nr:unnamed protein product [Porites evermanni]
MPGVPSPGPSQSVPTTKPKRYSSQRQQRTTQQIPVSMQQAMMSQMGAVYPDQAYFEQLAYQGLYVPAGTPPAQPVGVHVLQEQPDVMLRQDMAVTPGDRPEMAAGMPMANPSPQPMGALQHETMMQQQLAAAAAAVAAQQSVAPEGVAAPRVPQPALNPQQQQVLAAHLQMQAQQGFVQSAQLGPVPQPNMVTSAGYVPNYTGVQSFAGQPMMYNNSQFPMMNVGMNPFLGQQMYGMPMQGGGTFYPPPAALMQQQQQPQQSQAESSQQPHTRRRPTAAIPIKPPQVGVD